MPARGGRLESSSVYKHNNDLESLVDINVEPAGSNCPNGGERVDTGIDDNGDGILQANEIDDTNFICDDPSFQSPHMLCQCF